MKKILVLVVFTLSLLLVSCGGGAGVSSNIDVTMTDFQFQPAQFTVPAGEEIAFSSTNSGSVIHNFVVMKLGTSAGELFDDEDLPNVYWKTELAPGASTTTSFVAPTEPGDYEVVCSTQGHIASGMVGKLTVVAPKE